MNKALNRAVEHSIESYMNSFTSSATGIEFELELLSKVQNLSQEEMQSLMEESILNLADEYATEVVSEQSEEFGCTASAYWNRVREDKCQELMFIIWDEKLHVKECHDRLAHMIKCKLAEHNLKLEDIA